MVTSLRNIKEYSNLAFQTVGLIRDTTNKFKDRIKESNGFIPSLSGIMWKVEKHLLEKIK